MPQYSVDSRTIENVVGYIKDGQISIPEIQRPFVWDSSKIRDLIDSLYNGYPIGYLIVWQNPNMKDKNGNVTLGKKIMIDGQQRVTALMTSIVGLPVLDKNFKERTICISYNPFAEEGEPKFEVQSVAIKNNKRWISDISVLFKPDFDSYEFVENYCLQNPDMPQKTLNKHIEKIRKIYQASIGIINLSENLSIAEVTEIFIRINSQGKSLTQADFVMSTIAADENHNGNHLRKAIDYFCHLCSNPDFQTQIKKDTDFINSKYYDLISWSKYDVNQIYKPTFEDIIRVVFMSQYYSAKLVRLTDLLHGRNFENRQYESSIMDETFQNFEEGLQQVCNKHVFTEFVNALKSAGFVFQRMINSRMAIDFAYTLFIRLRNENSINKLKVSHYVIKWYVMCMLTGRYTSSPETIFDKDLRQIKDKGFVTFYEEAMANLGDTFWTITLPQNLQTSSSTAPAFLVYQAAQCKLIDDSFLGNGSKVRDLLETADIHHLFPKKYLQENGIDTMVQYNQVANYVVLNKSVNISIGKKAPNEYMKIVADACKNGGNTIYTTLKSYEELLNNLRINCIPEDFESYDVTRYNEFLEKRRLLMAKKIKAYFESL